MAFAPCFSCGKKFPGKAATLYGAWMADEDTRVSYTLKVCLECVLQNLSIPVRNATRNDYEAICAIDGEDLRNQRHIRLFVTAYLPKREQEQFAIPFHHGCATALQAWFEEYGVENKRDDLGGLRGPAAPQGQQWETAW